MIFQKFMLKSTDLNSNISSGLKWQTILNTFQDDKLLHCKLQYHEMGAWGGVNWELFYWS